MDISNVGPGGVGRRAERPVEIARPAAHKPAQHKQADTASINDDAVSSLQSFDQRVRQNDGRDQIVQAAAEKLASGKLDTPEVYRSVASKLLGD